VVFHASIFAGDLLLFTPAPSLQDKRKILIVSVNIDEKIAKVDHSVAVVKDRCLDGPPEEEVLEQSERYTNPSKSPIDRTWSYTVSHAKGAEQARVKSSGWSLGATFAPSVSGLGIGVTSVGRLSGTYDRRKQETSSTSEVKNLERKYEKQFTIPAKSSVVVKHLQITKMFKCKVENINVNFNPKTKVKCKVQKVGDNSGKTEERQFELQEAFYLNNEIIPNNGKNKVLQRTVSASYEWNEIHTIIRDELVSD
jgi:hypothetical protein